MALYYVLTGGQLKLEKKVFTGELLLSGSLIKKLLKSENSEKKPKITGLDDIITIDYNDSADVLLDEGFYDLFKQLKVKYRGRIKGKVVIRVSAITSYHLVLNLDSEDDEIIYE